MNKMLIGASVIALATLFGASSTLAIAGDKKGEPQGMVEVEHGEHKAKGHDKHDKMDKMDKEIEEQGCFDAKLHRLAELLQRSGVARHEARVEQARACLAIECRRIVDEPKGVAEADPQMAQLDLGLRPRQRGHPLPHGDAGSGEPAIGAARRSTGACSEPGDIRRLAGASTGAVRPDLLVTFLLGPELICHG